MAIYKSKHASNYTVLPNEIFKSGLSLEAIGLLSYFLSLPADWVIYKTTLHEQLNLGRDKINRIFNELRTSGYLISVEKREAGKISYEHIIYDKPYNGEPEPENPLTEKPLPENPLTDSQPLLNTNKQSINKLIKKEQNKKEQKQNFNFPFSDVEFLSLWETIIKEPKWKKKTGTALQATLNKLGNYPLHVAVESLKRSLENGWQGVFPESVTIQAQGFVQHAMNVEKAKEEAFNLIDRKYGND